MEFDIIWMHPTNSGLFALQITETCAQSLLSTILGMYLQQV